MTITKAEAQAELEAAMLAVDRAVAYCQLARKRLDSAQQVLTDADRKYEGALSRRQKAMEDFHRVVTAENPQV